MAFAGAAAGALWMLGPAVLRAKLGVSEILTTLMLNYVAVPISNYFLYGPWKSPTAFNFPVTRLLSGNARLPQLPGFPVHIGFPIAIAGAAILYLALGRTSWGFQVRVIGDNRRAAEYLGFPIARLTVQVLCLSGALAGLAGMLHVAGVTHQMLPNLSPGYGYTGIIVASLALLDILATTVVSFLLAGLIVGSQSVQNTGVPAGLSFFLQGLVMLTALAAVALASRHQARQLRKAWDQKEGVAPA
jgi:simple sugar transport system permease protein